LALTTISVPVDAAHVPEHLVGLGSRRETQLAALWTMDANAVFMVSVAVVPSLCWSGLSHVTISGQALIA